jgi:hypothetical protein
VKSGFFEVAFFNDRRYLCLPCNVATGDFDRHNFFHVVFIIRAIVTAEFSQMLQITKTPQEGRHETATWQERVKRGRAGDHVRKDIKEGTNK